MIVIASVRLNSSRRNGEIDILEAKKREGYDGSAET